MWLTWFAWYPVQLTNGNIAWLKTIEWGMMADPRSPMTRVLNIYRSK